VSLPEDVTTVLAPAPNVNVSLAVPVVIVVAPEPPVNATPVAAVPATPLPVVSVIAPVAADASTVPIVEPPTELDTVKACEPVMFRRVTPVAASVVNVLAEVAELTVNVSIPAVVKVEPAATPFNVKVAASVKAVAAVTAVVYATEVVVLPPVMVVFTALPKPVTANEAPLEGLMLFTSFKPVTPVKSKVTGLGEGVKFNTSTPTNEVAVCVGAAPETVAFKVSVPAPPLTTSPVPHVPAAAVNVSSPVVPVEVCVAAVNVSAVFTTTELTAAYVPVAVPAVCDKACELAALALNVLAEAPNVASAVMLE